MNWWKKLKGRVSRGEPLDSRTTFKIGGPARFFIEPKDTEDLRLTLELAKKNNLGVLLLGAGSNVLVSDKGLKKVVVRLSAPYFKKIIFEGGFAQAGAGLWLNQAVVSAREKGLSGLEFLAGIPGTLGGALMMNAGISEKGKGRRPKTKSIGDLVENVTVMDYNGKIACLDKKKAGFGYRNSGLSGYIILGARLKLKRSGRKEIGEKLKGYLERRKLTHDLSRPSCGCIFKNPSGNSAGRLIDLCGLKGKRINGAAVSRIHANFILNASGAKSRDVLRLMALIKREVKKKFNITLIPEIKIWN